MAVCAAIGSLSKAMSGSMAAAIDACRTHFGLAPIVLESQYAVRGFYAKHGFKEVSDVFLENDIPHVMMRRTVQREETV